MPIMFMWVFSGYDAAGGSLLEAMATGIECAAVIIICFSERYKMSPQCRTGDRLLITKHYIILCIITVVDIIINIIVRQKIL